ncbi:hypothetical protein [Cellulosimicrobium sp. NPDC057862]
MHIIPSGDTGRTPDDADTLTIEDLQLMDLLALHVICGTMREARR